MTALAAELAVGRQPPLELPPLVVDGRVIQDRYHGIGRQTFELLRELGSAGVELEVLVGDAPDTRLSVHDLPRLDNLRLVPFGSGVASAAQQLRWPGRLRGLRGRILIVPYHLAAPLVAPLPRATFVHDCILEEHPQFAPAGTSLRVYRAATRAALARSAAVLTVSEATRIAIERVYGRRLDPAAVVRSGVDPSFGDPATRGAVAAVRERYGLARPYVLHVGARRPHKNQVVLVRALRALVGRGVDADLVLVGGRDERVVDPTVRELATLPPGRVHELDRIDESDLRALYAGAAVFAFPSHVEGYGLPVLEAMRAGLPVVATTAPAVAEAAAGGALLVDPADPVAWADALGAVLADHRLAGDLRARGRRVADAATWRRAAEELARALAPLARTVTR